MAVEEVACPHCGHVTMATVPQDGQVKFVRKQASLYPDRCEATCSGCDFSFVIEWERV